MHHRKEYGMVTFRLIFWCPENELGVVSPNTVGYLLHETPVLSVGGYVMHTCKEWMEITM